MKSYRAYLAVLNCFGVLALCSTAPAQSPVASRAKAGAAAAYSLEPIVIEQLDTLTHMAADGTGYEQKTIVARIQGQSALKQLSVVSMGFAANSQRVEWSYARVRHSDGTVSETPVNTAIEVAEPVTREAPFYSDLKQMQLPLKDLQVGDRLEWQARVIRTKPEAPGEFWGQKSFVQDGVVLAETVELEVPKEKYVQVWSPKSKAVESFAGEEHVYRWESKQLKPTVGVEADAAKEAEKKRIRTADEEIDEREGKLPDLAWTTFKSWSAVGAWYRGLEGERMQPDAEIRAKVAQLTAGKTTETEKVQAVYGYVATQIHYIGVAFGVGRYQPHTAGDVLGNQYGDCKDKHTLLASMLEALGLHPDAVLIGAGIRFNEAVPSPSSFNHLITRVDVEGKPVWLDTTAEVAPYGMLLYVTRDHQALAVPERGEAKVERTPAELPFRQQNTMQAMGTLDAEGESNSKLTLTFRGDTEVVVRSVLRQISPAQYDEFAQQLCAGMGYIGTASHLETSRVDDTSEPIRLTFDYKRVKGGDWDNLRAIPQLTPVNLARPDPKDPPVESIALGTPRVEESEASMKLPEGWGAELPEAVHEKSAYFSYDLTYRFEKGTMYANRRVEVLTERVPVADWKSFDKFANKVGLGNENYVQLTRTEAAKDSGAKKVVVLKAPEATDEKSTMSASEKDAEAKRLITEAYTLAQQNDLSGSKAMLEQAKAISEKQPGLWSMYGYLAFREGDLPGAEQDYRKELELHPANIMAFPPLIQTQLALHKKDDAKASLRQWEVADPANATPTLQLAQMELEEGDASAAAKTAGDGLARTAEGEKRNERLELQLGRAQLKAGMKEKGHETLLALLKGTDDPALMNDTAYDLADAGLELALAEQTTRTALDKMEQQSRTWTLDESEQTLRQKSALLQATWDTMGWIYFREGKLKEAEDYIQAAWKGRQDAEVGKHLAELAAARGDKNAALTDYELAQATIAGYDLMGVRTAPNAAQKVLMQRTDELRKAGARSSVTDAREALQKMRSIPLGPARGLNGVAEYKLLLGGNAVERVEATGTKQVPGGLERLKTTKLSGFIPPGSQAQLVLRGILNCHSSVCEVVLLP